MNKIFLILLMFVFAQNTALSQPAHDIVADELFQNKITEKPITNTIYNYENLEYKIIRLRIINDVTSELKLYEGEKLCFEVVTPVYHKGKKLVEKNEKVYATVETIIKNGMNGIPASIIIGNFEFQNIENNKLQDYIEIYGADLSWLVFPLKWALTILPPTGSLTNFIKGGHAKIKENDIITLKYYPNR